MRVIPKARLPKVPDLHDVEQKKVFDTVVVISDRNVIDQQLRNRMSGQRKEKRPCHAASAA